MSLCDWHISLSRMSSRSIRFIVCGRMPSLLKAKCTSLWLCLVLLLHLFIGGDLGCFYLNTALWSWMLKYLVETLLSVLLPMFCPSFISVARIKYLDLKQREKRVYSAYISRPQPSIKVSWGRAGCYSIQHCFWLRIPLHSHRNMEGQWRMLLDGSQVGLMLS